MKKATVLATAAMALVFGACNDSQFDGFTRAENGLHYKFFNHTENVPTVQKGDYMILSYVITKQGNDSLIINSKSVSQDGSGYVNFPMKNSSFTGSFEDGLMMMAKGDSAAFVISADSFFLKTNRENQLPAGFKPGEHLKGVFKIKEIRTAKEVEENQKKQQAEQEAANKQREAIAKELQPKEKPALEKYLADNKITTKPTASGLIYVETKKGNGKKPSNGQLVKLNYTGRLLNGTIFDTSDETTAKSAGVYDERRGPYQPIEFPIGQGQVIAGWEEGILMMSVGSKGKLIIPSALAYGANGGGPIPPYSTLVFEVELLDINPAPAQGSSGDASGALIDRIFVERKTKT